MCAFVGCTGVSLLYLSARGAAREPNGSVNDSARRVLGALLGVPSPAAAFGVSPSPNGRGKGPAAALPWEG
ncbi:MAG: hypothetical protein EOO77_47350 [Oxalobacteraceae bacterium]|nr:MAG: hypothetical protein EOO77_47350 [Oxalobacteraceae bacterium]